MGNNFKFVIVKTNILLTMTNFTVYILCMHSHQQEYVVISQWINPQHAYLLYQNMNMEYVCFLISHNYFILKWYRPPQFFFMVNRFEAKTKWPPFPDDIFKSIFLNENVKIATKMSLNFVPNGTMNNTSVLVQIMTWRHPGPPFIKMD